MIHFFVFFFLFSLFFSYCYCYYYYYHYLLHPSFEGKLLSLHVSRDILFSYLNLESQQLYWSDLNKHLAAYIKDHNPSIFHLLYLFLREGKMFKDYKQWETSERNGLVLLQTLHKGLVLLLTVSRSYAFLIHIAYPLCTSFALKEEPYNFAGFLLCIWFSLSFFFSCFPLL